MYRSNGTVTEARRIPRPAIERAYHDLVAIHHAGLERQFLDDYQSAVMARDWITGYRISEAPEEHR